MTNDEPQWSLDDYEPELIRDLEDATGHTEGNWFSIFDKGWERIGKLDLLADALAEAGHWRRDFTVAVMAAAYCENYLRKLIDLRVDMEALEPSEVESVPFAMLVRLARSLEVLPDKLQRPLKAFARLRNRFAHDIDYRLSEADREMLDKTLDAKMRDEIEKYLTEAVASKKQATPLESYLRLFASALVDELETTLRSHETVEDSFR
jgi:hypothetical protein